MTKEEMQAYSAKLSSAIEASNAAYMAYRVARANKILELANPADGSKKPTEKIIDSTIESDDKLNALKDATLVADANLEVARFEAKAMLTIQA